MDFPAYVPAAVRAQIGTLIEGDEREPHGWGASLRSAERELSEIERAIEARTRRGEVEYLKSLRQQRAETVKHRDMLAGIVGCLQRLAQDPRMREAFASLTREFSNDNQWRFFIYSAFGARMDYAPYRERLKRAAELKDEIADAADMLAKLIRQFSETGVYGPNEFYSVLDLLRKTDNHEMHGHNLYMWRAMRPHVLGDLPRRDMTQHEQAQEGGDQTSAPEIVTQYVTPEEEPDMVPVEQARNTLRYAWGVAPDLSALLDTLAEAARDFKASQSGMVGAAIEKRQQNVKTEYLRAFAHLLTDEHHFILTTPIKKAMAIVANVVIDLPDVDVTYDDVRKVLDNLDGERLENSKRE